MQRWIRLYCLDPNIRGALSDDQGKISVVGPYVEEYAAGTDQGTQQIDGCLLPIAIIVDVVPDFRIVGHHPKRTDLASDLLKRAAVQRQILELEVRC